ncbi:cytochrome P450 46A1 [Penicillium malachiteum]|uniref:Cytochrome P450 46A1 n=1 Tax=Penicillium malachiteum TaxID=1324776 RepID=A0AAD6HL44_9EURO|nr:cytochrome P450 46A1 [Penicillium malachiteum]
MHQGIEELRAMAAKAVENARQMDAPDSNEKSEESTPKIFEILAKQREPDGSYTFSSKELCDNYVAFLVAGGDPTAHTMSFFVYEVLRRQDILAKLRAELDVNIPSDVAVPSLDQADLPYLNMILKETLRYSSTGFGTFRTCPFDTEMEGVVLPANTTLALWNPAVHRDPTLWDNPDTFDPERWRTGQSKIKGSYFPFSYGPRNCLGQGLSMLVMRLTLATLFRRYDLILEPGFEMEYLPSFTLRPKRGLPVKIVRRKS